MSTKEVEIVERVENEKSTYEFRSDGIIVITVKDDSFMELDDVKKEFALMHERPDYLPMLALIHSGKNTSVSKEVRDYINTDECRKMIKAEAIITNSLAHKLILNFMRKVYTLPINMKIFKTSEEGEKWLEEQRLLP